jgi:tRNA (cytidine/uridine-2'-O-)-methyltransferase
MRRFATLACGAKAGGLCRLCSSLPGKGRIQGRILGSIHCPQTRSQPRSLAASAIGQMNADRDAPHGGDAPLLTLALYQPDIPQNCGTMLRLCACLGVSAAIIEPAGFPVSDRAFRRAGMDYLDHVMIERHLNFVAFAAWRRQACRRLVLLTTQASLSYCDFAFAPGDILLVGRESAGVPEAVHAAADARIVIPLKAEMRSLNVAVAAAMVVGEALRQISAHPDKS